MIIPYKHWSNGQNFTLSFKSTHDLTNNVQLIDYMLLNVQQQKFLAHSGREQVKQYLQKIFGIKGGKEQILQSLTEFFHLLPESQN